jgi:hypothetical protein
LTFTPCYLTTTASQQHQRHRYRRVAHARTATAASGADEAAEHWRKVAQSQERQIAQLKHKEEQAFAAGRAEGLSEGLEQHVQGGLLTEEQEKEVIPTKFARLPACLPAVVL